MSSGRSASGLTPVEEDLGFLLARASGVVVRAANAALETYGLRVRHLSMLRLVAERARSQRELSQALGLDPSNAVSLIDDLEDLGLVQRTPDPQDRRARVVRATNAGLATLPDAVTDSEAGLDQALGTLGASDRVELRRLLRVALDAHL